MASTDLKSRSRGLKALQDRPKRLQKTPKTLKIAEVDISQRHGPKPQKEKRRAGGGDPPWGSQSAAPGAARDACCEATMNIS